MCRTPNNSQSKEQVNICSEGMRGMQEEGASWRRRNHRREEFGRTDQSDEPT